MKNGCLYRLRSAVEAHSHARCGPCGVSNSTAAAREVQAVTRSSTSMPIFPYRTQAVTCVSLTTTHEGCPQSRKRPALQEIGIRGAADNELRWGVLKRLRAHFA